MTTRYYILWLSVFLNVLSLGAQDFKRQKDSIKLILSDPAVTDSARMTGLYNLFQYEFREGNWQNVIRYAEQGIPLFEKMHNDKALALAYKYLGDAYWIMNDLSEALRLELVALSFYEKIDDKLGMAKVLMGLSVSYSHIGSYTLGLEYCLKSLALTRQAGSLFDLAQIYNVVAETYTLLESYDKASLYIDSALAIYTKNPEQRPHWAMPWSFFLIGDVYRKTGKQKQKAGDREGSLLDFQKSFAHFNEALRLIYKANNTMQAPETHLAIAELQRDAGHYTVARKHVDSAVRVMKKMDDQLNMDVAHLQYAILDSIQGDYQSAYQHYKLSVAYSDRGKSGKAIWKMEEYKTAYELEKKENAIQLLAAENKLQAAIVSTQQQQKTVTYFSLGLLLITGGYTFYRYRLKKRRASQRALAEERLRISRELNESVGTTLSGVAMYTHLATAQIHASDKARAAESLNLIQRSSAEMVNTLNDIVWLISPRQDSLQKMVERLEDFSRNLAAQKELHVSVLLEDKLKSHVLPVKTRRALYLVCKSAIYDSISHGGADQLRLTVKEVNKKLALTVSDNREKVDPAQTLQADLLATWQRLTTNVASISVQPSVEGGLAVMIMLNRS